MKRKLLITIAVLVAIGAAPPAQAEVAAEVRYTAFGVAHVTADSYEGAGLGYGWALARDNLCVVVEKAVTLAGERSRSMPADETYYDGQSFGEISNIDSDAVYRYILSPQVLRRVRNAASGDVRALVRGYVRGFNRHAAGAALEGETCRQQGWYRPLTEDDVWRRIAHTPMLETTARVLRDVIAAAPPGVDQSADAVTRPAEIAALEREPHGASNAMAFGRDAVEGGVGGLSFANPHYVWHGAERLHAMHLQVRGRLNVFGATLYGLPFPILGFSDSIGWAITHTTDKRVTIYRLDLDPEDPTRYFVGGRRERMRRVDVAVDTQGGRVLRSFWETRYGPLMESGNLPWDGAHAYTLADPEVSNVRFADQFLAIARANNVREINLALHRFQGAPWSNVTAADRDGEVYYSNITVAANITDAQLRHCVVSGPARTYMDRADFTTLNGSDPACVWTRAAGARQRGIIPARDRPWMVRSDVAFNSNDSHWYSTLAPDARLEGFQRVIGPERTARGERTRVAALYAREIMEGDTSGGAPGATPERWEQLFFSARNLTAELILDDLLADCRATPSVTLADGAQVDLAPACAALERWDRHDTLDSRGAALFGEFLRTLAPLMPSTEAAARYWRIPFDPADPVGTPSGFVVNDDVRQAFGRAVRVFRDNGLALDAPLRDQQAVTRNGVRMPISGSSFGYHRIAPGPLVAGQGITEIRAGDSYIHVVALTPDGVRGRFIVTYSQSTNPQSPHFADMTQLFSERHFADVAFSDSEVSATQVGETVTLRSP